MTERNDGRLWYDSAQFVANKRWSRGVTLNATYTWVPRWRNQGSDNGGQAFIDNITLEKVDGPYYAHREHRITASGVWELPWRGRRDLIGYLLGGWSIAPMFVYQSGQPWGMPGNVELLGDPSAIALSPRKDGQFIYGAKPCVGQRQSNGSIRLLDAAVAYGCTEPLFLVREPFQRRTTQFRYDEFRRPSFWQVDLNFAKTTPITDRVRLQVRLEAFNLFNSPMYDERQVQRRYGQRRLREDQSQLDGAVELPALPAARVSVDVLTSGLEYWHIARGRPQALPSENVQLDTASGGERTKLSGQ